MGSREYSNNRKLFRRAFREASPLFGRSRDDNDDGPEIEISQEELELARRLTSSIERLTDIARRDSFSSISSCGQREQFKTALTNLQTSIYGNSHPGERESTPIIMDPHPKPSGSSDSDHDFEHLDAPDPFELASYHAQQQQTQQSSKPSMKMSQDSPHNISPEHHATVPQHHQETRPYDFNTEPTDPFGAHGVHHHEEHSQLQQPNNELHHDKEELLVDLDSSEPSHHQNYGESQVNTDPEPPTLGGYEFQQHTHNEPHQDFNPHHESPQLPDEPSPANYDFTDDRAISPPRHHESPDEEQRRHIEEDIHDAVNDTHDEVDAILERLHTPDPAEVAVPPVPEETSPSADSERDTVGHLAGDFYNEPEPNLPASDSTHGIREFSPNEETFDRRGPLTIPQHDSPVLDEAPSAPPAYDDDFEQVSPSHNFHQIPPRPPTPPKDLDDEDVKPPAIDLGPAPVHHYEKSPDDTSGLKPILKHHSDVEPWIDTQHVDQRVLDIIYWRDPKKSGIVLGAIFVTLFLLCKFSFISLVAYSAIAVLLGTLGFRIFKLVDAKFIKKTKDENPFQPLLEKEIEVPQEKIHAQVDVLVENGRNIALQLRRLFLVENMLDSVKFFFLLYSLTYIGAMLSGLALIILFILGVFTIPKVYEMNKETIDQYLNLAKENVDKLHQTVGEKVPFLKQAHVEAKKEE